MSSHIRLLKKAFRKFPVGSRVRVVSRDLPELHGTGVVASHEDGGPGTWPLISVVYDSPPEPGLSTFPFHEDELVLIERSRKPRGRMRSLIKRSRGNRR